MFNFFFSFLLKNLIFQIWDSWGRGEVQSLSTQAHTHTHTHTHTCCPEWERRAKSGCRGSGERPSLDKSPSIPHTLSSASLRRSIHPLLYFQSSLSSHPLPSQTCQQHFFFTGRTDTRHELFPRPCPVWRGRGGRIGGGGRSTSSTPASFLLRRLTNKFISHHRRFRHITLHIIILLNPRLHEARLPQFTVELPFQAWACFN